jgi:hypothetical protein
MDPTPLTAGQFFSMLGTAVLGLTVPPGLILGTAWLASRWWDRQALHRARADWEAWRAAHPEEAEDDLGRRHRLSRQLWLEEQPVYIQAHVLRQQLADARREARVRAMLDAEQGGASDGR